ISLAGFYIAMFSIGTPDTMLVKITSFVPLLSPMVMLLRTISDTTPEWHILLGILISIVTCIFLLIFATKTYRGNVLTYDKGLIKNFKNVLNMTKNLFIIKSAINLSQNLNVFLQKRVEFM